MSKENTCCFTGHRKIEECEIENLKKRLNQTVKLLIKKGYLCFVVGGALGFDTLAAQTVLSLKKDYPTLLLIVVAPFIGQSDRFPPHDKDVYDEIKSQADHYIALRQNYQRGCMMERNKKMVDISSCCVAYLKNSKSGTAFTVRYAKKKDMKIVDLGDEYTQTSLFSINDF